uniref:Uncharacterized protein n=1 Tax=Steinernema glaseri TaxID=37863 RepID=A0A1I8AAE3_9BILA
MDSARPRQGQPQLAILFPHTVFVQSTGPQRRPLMDILFLGGRAEIVVALFTLSSHLIDGLLVTTETQEALIRGRETATSLQSWAQKTRRSALRDGGN